MDNLLRQVVNKNMKRMKCIGVPLFFILLNFGLLGCKDNSKEAYQDKIGKFDISPDDLLNHKFPSRRATIYNLYELQLVTGKVIQDTLTFNEESDYINDRLTVYADKVVYARVLKDSVLVR